MFRHLATEAVWLDRLRACGLLRSAPLRLSAVPRLGETAIYFSIKLQDGKYGTIKLAVAA